MSNHRRTYTFHGLQLVIESNRPEVLDALHTRFRLLPPGDVNLPELYFSFICVPNSMCHLVPTPVGQWRPVYDSAIGDVLYTDATDCFYLNSGDDGRVFADLACRHVQVSYVASAQERLWLLSCPLFTLPFIELLKRYKRYSLHAAGLCVNGQGILIPGTSGAGKTTLTIALLRAGCDILGDDLLFLTEDQSGLKALAFPDAINVTETTAGFFPELADHLYQPAGSGWPKRRLQFEDVYSQSLVWDCQPSVLVFPRASHQEQSRLLPMTKTEALVALAPNVLLTEAESSQHHLTILAALVDACACYQLETGRDFETLPERLCALAASGQSDVV